MIYYDNQSVIQVVENPIAHNKMKCMELHAHYLRQLLQENVVNLVYCKTDDQVVDIFMKSLGSKVCETSSYAWASRRYN